MGFALSDIKLTSSSFNQDGSIPARHTGEGEDVSPSLSWENVPEGTRSFAVICHDPDAPLLSSNGTYGFVHWVYYNIPASVTSLAEGNTDFTNGMTNFGKEEYGGPMPPVGHGLHHYYFWIMALKDDKALPSGLTLWQLLEKIEPSVIAMNRLVGTYTRNAG
jgi:Raf kinase inhibitor-like YbhB/YbcL family protein